MDYQARKNLLIILIIAAIGMLLGYFIIIQNKGGKITMDGLRLQKNIAEFARDADLIVVGTVKEERPAVQDPATGYIYRNVIITVERFLKNTRPYSEVKVNLYGGKVGNIEVQIGDGEDIKLTQGERVLLFLGNDTITKEQGDYWIYSAPDGKFTLDAKDNAAGSDNERTTIAELEQVINKHKGDQRPPVVCDPALASLDLPQGYIGPDARCFKQKAQ